METIGIPAIESTTVYIAVPPKTEIVLGVATLQLLLSASCDSAISATLFAMFLAWL